MIPLYDAVTRGVSLPSDRSVHQQDRQRDQCLNTDTRVGVSHTNRVQCHQRHDLLPVEKHDVPGRRKTLATTEGVSHRLNQSMEGVTNYDLNLTQSFLELDLCQQTVDEHTNGRVSSRIGKKSPCRSTDACYGRDSCALYRQTSPPSTVECPPKLSNNFSHCCTSRGHPDCRSTRNDSLVKENPKTEKYPPKSDVKRPMQPPQLCALTSCHTLSSTCGLTSCYLTSCRACCNIATATMGSFGNQKEKTTGKTMCNLRLSSPSCSNVHYRRALHNQDDVGLDQHLAHPARLHTCGKTVAVKSLQNHINGCCLDDDDATSDQHLDIETGQIGPPGVSRTKKTGIDDSWLEVPHLKYSGPMYRRLLCMWCCCRQREGDTRRISSSEYHSGLSERRYDTTSLCSTEHDDIVPRTSLGTGHTLDNITASTSLDTSHTPDDITTRTSLGTGHTPDGCSFIPRDRVCVNNDSTTVNNCDANNVEGSTPRHRASICCCCLMFWNKQCRVKPDNEDVSRLGKKWLLYVGTLIVLTLAVAGTVAGVLLHHQKIGSKSR